MTAYGRDYIRNLMLAERVVSRLIIDPAVVEPYESPRGRHGDSCRLCVPQKPCVDNRKYGPRS